MSEKNGFHDLIEALQIFAKYASPRAPTHCEHDVLYIMGVDEEDPTSEEKQRLDELGFLWCDDCWLSFRFGSA